MGLPKNELALHQKVQKRLHIKYVSAKQLTEQALNEFKLNPDLVDIITEEDVVEEVVRIFNKLSQQQQHDMMMGDNDEGSNNANPEPEWKRKARLAAEKREAEWQRQQQHEMENNNSTTNGTNNDDEEPLQPGMSKTISTTTTSTTTSKTITKGPTSTTTTKKDGKWHSVKKGELTPEYEAANPDKVQKHTKEVNCLLM